MGQKMIAMTSASRPEYLRRALESWLKVKGVERYGFHVRQEPGKKAAECVEALANVGLGDVTMNVKREGPLTNPWLAIDDCFDLDHEFVVYAEDDVIVSNDVLKYMEWAADKYVDDRSVLGVVAMNRTYGQEGDQHQVIRGSRWPANVFGTWSDRWYETIRPGWDHTYAKRGWDWWLTSLLGDELQTITPLWSRSQHIGKFGGSHMPPRNFEQHLAGRFELTYPIGEFHE